jgi:hypothetical protein
MQKVKVQEGEVGRLLWIGSSMMCQAKSRTGAEHAAGRAQARGSASASHVNTFTSQ